jgi:NADH dehydrogenase [ubiquinone] 1 alpha subcomplex assembly factor 7
MSGDDTPLALQLKAEIRAGGSISVERFMRACLYDPEHGYYARRDVLGATGDFVTAPEISQVFGELIGLWCAAVWQQMGSPPRVSLIEFGPGRGTLMADALRAARLLPAFADALTVHLVEVSEKLRAVQAKTLEAYGAISIAPDWPEHDDLAPGPVIVIGNEFIDALPIDQFVFHAGAWRLRSVGLDDSGAFSFVPAQGSYPNIAAKLPPQEGDVFETSAAGGELSRYLGRLIMKGRRVAALLIDYGHMASAFGDTLQGVRGHRHASPLTRPGETDLSTQVDFAALGLVLRGAGFGMGNTVVEPVTTQAEFLGSLGVVERASRLMAANPARAADIEASVARLLAPTGMGTRFKVLGMRNGLDRPLPGFPGRSRRKDD